MGRALHDLALDELEMGNNSAAREYLEQARSYLVQGLRYAQETKDTLEELGILAELAFIIDDFMVVVGPEKIPEEYLASLDEFKRTLDAHRKDKFRIYQFDVFDNLYKLEKAATDYRQEDYEKALKGYLEANVGLASDPGYSRSRYKQHFPHLAGQIENLPPEVAKVWCDAFIQTWEKKTVSGKSGRTLAQEVRRPDLVVWCRKHLNKIETQKG
jgi:tetratricopeptide (TPR) repeat protein